MDNAEKAIEQVNADQIYTSKQFQRIKDNFFVSQYCDLDMDAHGQLSWVRDQDQCFPNNLWPCNIIDLECFYFVFRSSR